MNNKIAMVNKELHTKLFDEEQFPDQDQQQPRIYRRHQLPPQLMLKNMIKKGLTNTQPLFNSRPKTAQSTFKRTIEDKPGMDRLRSTATSHLLKKIQNRRYEEHAQQNNDFDFNREQPKEFEQFDKILDRLKYERQQEKSRKKLKLDKYGERKFRFAWKKCNIPE